jgi:hypothetical protein
LPFIPASPVRKPWTAEGGGSVGKGKSGTRESSRGPALPGLSVQISKEVASSLEQLGWECLWRALQKHEVITVKD